MVDGPDEQPSTHVLEQPPAKKACRPLMSGQRDDGARAGAAAGFGSPQVSLQPWPGPWLDWPLSVRRRRHASTQMVACRVQI
jgi:hypothetical protein